MRGWSGLGLAVAVLVTAGCAVVPPGASGVPATSAPSASASATSAAPTSAAASPSTSSTPTAPASSASASATGAAVKARGELLLYDGNLVSDQLVGSCETADGRPTITLSDDANDFFASVAVQVVLGAGAQGVESVDIDLGEDSESITHTIRAEASEKGSALAVTRSGDGFKVTGKGTMTDDGKVSATGVPFQLKATCTGFTP